MRKIAIKKLTDVSEILKERINGKKTAFVKKASQRRLEARELVKNLKEYIYEAISTADRLRLGMDDVLSYQQIRELYELSKKLQEINSKFMPKIEKI